MDVETGLLGGGITAAVVALVYTIKKVVERSKCHSNSGCCELDIQRQVEEQVRQATERDMGKMIELVVKKLREEGEESLSTRIVRQA
jgi:uncharacterized protein YjaG (DUF416 family)